MNKFNPGCIEVDVFQQCVEINQILLQNNFYIYLLSLRKFLIPIRSKKLLAPQNIVVIL